MTADEESPHEPDLPDPGAEAESVEFDATTGQDLVDRLPSGSAVPPELARTFWSAVLLANVALLGVSLGLLFAFFRGWSIPAGLLVLVGLVAGIRTVRRVRAFEGP